MADIDLDAVQREIRMYLASDWVGANRVSIAVSLAEQMPALVEEVRRAWDRIDELADESHDQMHGLDNLTRECERQTRRALEAECDLEQERRACAALRDERDRLRDELGAALEELAALKGYIGPAIQAVDGVYERVSEESGAPVPDHVDGHPAGHRQTGEPQ